MKTGIKEDIKKVYTRFIVDESVTEWLKESSEIIFDIAQRAIQENRFEVVDSALKNIFDLVDEYIKARVEYSTERDIYIDYVHSRLIDSKNLVNKDTHPKIMLSIVRTAKDIAISTFQIKPIRSFAGENYMPLGFITLLSEICLSQEILKDTSYAPMTSIDFLVEIANAAINNNFPKTTTLVTDKLGAIATSTTKLHFLYGDTISAKANWGLASILDYMFYRQEQTKLYLEYEFKSILEQIDRSISTFVEDDIKFQYSSRDNIKTFFGPLAEHGMASVFIKALRSNNDHHLQINIKILEQFLVDMNQIVMKGMNNSKYLDVRDILENIYLIETVFVNVMKKEKDSRLQIEMSSLLQQRFYLPFTNAILMSFKRDTNKYTIFDDEYIDAFFSLMGIMFCENEKHLFDNILETWAGKIIDIIQKYKSQTTIEHEGNLFERSENTSLLRKLYKNLRLLGVWFNHFIPKSKLLDIIISEIKAQPQITISRGAFDEVNMYPSDFMVQRWIVLRPFLPFNPKYYRDLDSALFNDEIVKSFETKLKGNTDKNKKTK